MVGRVIVTGAQTDACRRATLHGAFVRGYDTTLVADAHTNMYWTWQAGPARTASVIHTADVTFSQAST